MDKNQLTRRSPLTDTLIAFGINIAFLALILGCFYVRFETNDDVLMSKFVDGQMARKTAYVPFINIAQGFLLKTLYTLGGDRIQWWSVCEYAVSLLGFTAATFVLLRRHRLFPALVMTVVLLSAFGTDCYLSMNFSKPSAIATVGGLTLMLHAMRNEEGRVLRLPLALGFILSLLAFSWRYEEFFACAAILAGIGAAAAFEIIKEGREKCLRPLLRYASVFIALVAAVLVLHGVNYLAWNTDEYRDFYEFNRLRSELIDYEVPKYDAMPEVYASLDMDDNAVELLRTWNFYDTEKYTADAFRTIIEARKQLIPRRTAGECLGILIDKCLPALYLERPMAGFLFLLALYLACGKRRGSALLGAAWLLGAFFALYMYFIYADRMLANRVDIGLFMAMAMGLSFLLDERRLADEKLLCAVVLCLSLFVGWRYNRKLCLFDSHAEIEDKSADKAAIARVLEDAEHIYFTKFLAVDHELYTPTEIAPTGYGDKILQIGGWGCRHPELERVLDDWGIENPWAELAGSETMLLIDKDIDRSLAYIRKYYCPTAAAELVEPLSSETGLSVYRITKG